MDASNGLDRWEILVEQLYPTSSQGEVRRRIETQFDGSSGSDLGRIQECVATRCAVPANPRAHGIDIGEVGVAGAWTTMPEPGTPVLLTAGVAGLAVRRRG